MYGRLVKSFEGWLMGRVRGVVDLKLQSVEQISFGEYVLSLPPSCNSFILDIKDREGEDAVGEQAVIDIGRELAYYLVDRLFGGGSEATILDRAMTPIERMAVRVVAERVMALVQEIWEDHVELELGLTGFESIPEIIQAASREAPVLVTNIYASFAGTSSLVSIALPLSVLEKFFVTGSANAVAHTPRRELPGQRMITEGALRATRVEVAARLPDFRLTMRDIAGLKAGSMLSTGIPVDSTVNLLVGDQPRFAPPRPRWRKLAVRVPEPLSNEASEPWTKLAISQTSTLTNAGQVRASSRTSARRRRSAEVPPYAHGSPPFSIELGPHAHDCRRSRACRGSVVQLERLAGDHSVAGAGSPKARWLSTFRCITRIISPWRWPRARLLRFGDGRVDARFVLALSRRLAASRCATCRRHRSRGGGAAARARTQARHRGHSRWRARRCGLRG